MGIFFAYKEFLAPGTRFRVKMFQIKKNEINFFTVDTQPRSLAVKLRVVKLSDRLVVPLWQLNVLIDKFNLASPTRPLVNHKRSSH